MRRVCCEAHVAPLHGPGPCAGPACTDLPAAYRPQPVAPLVRLARRPEQRLLLVTTYWCVRCLSTYLYSHDPVTGRGGIVQPCDCGTPTPGYFLGREWVQNVLKEFPECT